MRAGGGWQMPDAGEVKKASFRSWAFGELVGSKPSNRLDTNGDGYLSLEACRTSFSLAAIYPDTVEFFLAGFFNTALI